MDNDYHFGKRLRSLRKERRMTQGDLAPQIGMKRNNLSIIESQQKAPRGDVIERICNALGVDTSYWFADVVTDADHIENALLRLVRRGEYLAAIKIIINVMDKTATPPTE